MCFWDNQVQIRNSITEVFPNSNRLFLEPNSLFPKLHTSGNRCSCCPSSFSMDSVFCTLDSFLRSPCSEWPQKASYCSSPANSQNTPTMVKQYYEATEEANTASNPPMHYAASCHCWSQEEKENVHTRLLLCPFLDFVSLELNTWNAAGSLSCSTPHLCHELDGMALQRQALCLSCPHFWEKT